MDEVALSVLALLTLSFASVFAYVYAKKLRFPYTLFLVLLGIALVPVSKLEIFSFLNHFKLNPDLLFYVFLPTLLFEAAYNIKASKFKENLKPIAVLAGISLFISAFLSAGLLYFLLGLFGIVVPFEILLLFGAIISATDPVAVIAMFKEYGAPKRLALIFEGESLFNDGTAVALFLAILYLVQNKMELFSSDGALLLFASFSSMLALGVVFGLLSGMLFSKLLDFARSRHLQVTLMLISAHMTFLLSELLSEHGREFANFLSVSPIIATAVSAMVLGNYGRYKLSSEVEEYTNHFWHYFAFLANSLVFILLGFIISDIDFAWGELLLPATLAIFSVIVARALSVYLPFGLFKFKKPVPKAWQHLLAWGSLRGALALTMVLLIPDNLSVESWNFDLSPKEWLLSIVVLSIFFSLFIKGLSIPQLMRKLQLVGKLSKLEELEYLLAKIYTTNSLIKEINILKKVDYLKSKDAQEYTKKYKSDLQELVKDALSLIHKEKASFISILHLYAIGTEEAFVKDLYSKGELSESSYKKFLRKLEAQKEALESGSGNMPSFDRILTKSFAHTARQALAPFLKKAEHELEVKDKYLYYRALFLSARKVKDKLKELEEIFALDEFVLKIIKNVEEKYEIFEKRSAKKLEKLLSDNKELSLIYLSATESELKSAGKIAIDTLFNKGFISGNVAVRLEKDFACKRDD